MDIVRTFFHGDAKFEIKRTFNNDIWFFIVHRNEEMIAHAREVLAEAVAEAEAAGIDLLENIVEDLESACRSLVAD